MLPVSVVMNNSAGFYAFNSRFCYLSSNSSENSKSSSDVGESKTKTVDVRGGTQKNKSQTVGDLDQDAGGGILTRKELADFVKMGHAPSPNELTVLMGQLFSFASPFESRYFGLDSFRGIISDALKYNVRFVQKGTGKKNVKSVYDRLDTLFSPFVKIGKIQKRHANFEKFRAKNLREIIALSSNLNSDAVEQKKLFNVMFPAFAALEVEKDKKKKRAQRLKKGGVVDKSAFGSNVYLSQNVGTTFASVAPVSFASSSTGSSSLSPTNSSGDPVLKLGYLFSVLAQLLDGELTLQTQDFRILLNKISDLNTALTALDGADADPSSGKYDLTKITIVLHDGTSTTLWAELVKMGVVRASDDSDGTAVTADHFKNYKNSISATLSTEGTVSNAFELTIQALEVKRTNAYETASTLFKKQSDLSSTITRNI